MYFSRPTNIRKAIQIKVSIIVQNKGNRDSKITNCLVIDNYLVTVTIKNWFLCAYFQLLLILYYKLRWQHWIAYKTKLCVKLYCILQLQWFTKYNRSNTWLKLHCVSIINLQKRFEQRQIKLTVLWNYCEMIWICLQFAFTMYCLELRLYIKVIHRVAIKLSSSNFFHNFVLFVLCFAFKRSLHFIHHTRFYDISNC